ncbi:unnamed protein product [Fraxinus pennsylvanica]|uniref:DUS-like FMN-binding domain-containing protein n=1 Tax=Fraxinus pennsylvanica TaxID=56036 RepID=A0AAD1YX88_9LAMI|nr:unnamed protein product [Fraxinus pennsylvanica]
MDNLPLIKSLVENLADNLNVPVSCKIRIFPDLQDTINYAKMLEDAGCSLLAVHGRTRDEKDGKKIRANWNVIKAVKSAVRIPVLANGNIRHMDDVRECLEETGAEGVLTAESLLENPALFAGYRTAEWVSGSEEINKERKLDQADLLVEYLKFCEKYPVPWRMIRSHVHKLLGEWFRIHPNIRDDLNAQSKLTFEFLYDIVNQLRELGEPVWILELRVRSRKAITRAVGVKAASKKLLELANEAMKRADQITAQLPPNRKREPKDCSVSVLAASTGASHLSSVTGDKWVAGDANEGEQRAKR